ncbi:MAG: M1 family metallopeptidase [Bacteroidetes bacterium]|nr:M1 family metallopeptidase [Bacteroidota bacterium]
MRILPLVFLCLFLGGSSFAQDKKHDPRNSMFRPIDDLLPGPNSYRTASGAPGPEYWQNTADYKIDVRLDDATQRITGSEVITYTNNSPDVLTYLWVQLDQNLLDPKGIQQVTESTQFRDQTVQEWVSRDYTAHFPGGYRIQAVKDAKGNALPYTINYSQMRIDLPAPLAAKGGKVAFSIQWEYQVQDHAKRGTRTGFEYFPKDDNRLYELAHWYPRMCVYNDAQGWNNKQFLERGEFSLPFGNFEVSITVPADFPVAATGELTNPTQVLTPAQQERWKKARSEQKQPVLIITPQEAKDNEKSRSAATQTWRYKAERVRDFAWAASRKFIWDAMALDLNGRTVMCQSFYPNEGNPLWEMYSTKAVAHTVKTYSKYTVDFPWPSMISVNGPVGGMEYPMIVFNGPRPEADGTYTEQQKKGLISVVIHEVGHNFFPMLINSDERNSTWQDEGFNSFVQYLTEQEWTRDYGSRRGPALSIEDFLRADHGETICMHSDEISQFGATQYGKVSAGLNLLRETIMGRQLFDFAFKTYCQRWAFKHPMPADFFRTMEDASAVDLGWFWRGWFFGADPVDIALENVTQFALDRQNPTENKTYAQSQEEQRARNISSIRNRTDVKEVYADRDPSILDFYDRYDKYAVTKYDLRVYNRFRESLTAEEAAVLDKDEFFYQLNFRNRGGMPMPLIIQLEYTDGSTEELRIPAEIWRYNNYSVSKALVLDKELQAVQLDPHLEVPDVNRENNRFPQAMSQKTFEVYKPAERGGYNPMQLEKLMKEWKD